MNKISNISNIDTNTKICLTATQGLIFFRKGQISEGSNLYEKAIAAANYTKNKHLTWLAKLNYARELILSGSDKKQMIENLILKVPDNTIFPAVNKLKREIIALYKKQ